jgi:hypothetical protein
MRRRLLIGLVIVALFGVAGILESHRDSDRDATTVDAAWRAVGGRLVTLQSAGVVDEYGLRCFRYGLAAPEVDRRTLCFDPNGRLVTALHETRKSSSIATVLPDAGRAPIDIAPAKIALDSRRVMSLSILRSAVDNAIASLGPCEIANETLRSHVQTALARGQNLRLLLKHSARLSSATCRRAYGQIQSYGQPLARWRSLGKLVHRLMSRAIELASVAERLEPSTREQSPPIVTLYSQRTYRYREPLIIQRANRDAGQLRSHADLLIRRLVG